VEAIHHGGDVGVDDRNKTTGNQENGVGSRESEITGDTTVGSWMQRNFPSARGCSNHCLMHNYCLWHPVMHS